MLWKVDLTLWYSPNQSMAALRAADAKLVTTVHGIECCMAMCAFLLEVEPTRTDEHRNMYLRCGIMATVAALMYQLTSLSARHHAAKASWAMGHHQLSRGGCGAYPRRFLSCRCLNTNPDSGEAERINNPTVIVTASESEQR